MPDISFFVKSISSITMALLLSGCGATAKSGVIENTGSKMDTSPCVSIDRDLTAGRKKTLEPALAKQLNVPEVNIIQSFKDGEWNIIGANSHNADEVFLFYARSPLTNHYLTLWSGAATIDEEQKIKDWAFKNASGIPPELASCFAWYVTKGR